MSKAVLINLAKYLVSAALLAFVLHSANLFSRQGWADLAEIAANANPVYIVCALCFTLVMVLVSAIKWFYLSRDYGLKNGLVELFKYYAIGQYFNLTLPSNIGGDISRVILQGKPQDAMSKSAAIVFLDRMTGLLVLVVLFAGSIMLSSQLLSSDMVVYAIVFSVFVLVVAMLGIYSDRFYRTVRHSVFGKLKPVQKLWATIDKFRSHAKQLREMPKTFLTALFWALIFYACAAINIWLCVVAFDPSVKLYTILVAVPLVFVLMNLPISIGDIGLLEFACALVLGVFGVSAAVVLSAVILLRLKSISGAVLGWLLYISLPQSKVDDLRDTEN